MADGTNRATEPGEAGTFPARGAEETAERAQEAEEKRGGARSRLGRGRGKETNGVEDITIPDYVMRDFGPPDTEKGGSR